MHKIVYLGHHKCASTYIILVLQQVSQLLGLRVHTEYLSSRLPLGYEKQPEFQAQISRAFKALESTHCDIVCHGNADRIVAASVARNGPLRGFHVIRDPRDLVVSAYFWDRGKRPANKNLTAPWNQERAERLQAVSSEEEGMLLSLSFSEVYLQALAEWDYGQPNVAEMRYEDMIVDPLAFFSAAFASAGISVVDNARTTTWAIGLNRFAYRRWRRPLIRTRVLPQSTLRQVLDANSFERQANGRKPGENAPGHKYRKGVAGDWRNYFTPRVADAFRAQYGDLLVQLGYEQDKDWGYLAA